MATNEDINIRVHSEGGERAIGITPEQTERGIGIDQEAIVVRSVKSYNDLDDKPQINSVELEGDKSASDLGFADVAMSGSYNDLTDTPEIPAAQVNADWNADSGVAEILNKPTIPTKTSQLSNDSGFLTSESDPVFSTSAAASITSQDITDWNNKSDFSGDYNDLTNKPTIPTKTSDLVNDGADNTSTYLEADETAYRGASIPFGVVDNTSTSTVFTATVPGITELRDGVCMWLKNGTVTSASGFTININNLGAKPVYSNMSAASAESTLFNVNYTFMFVYDSSRVAGGCWMLDRGYNSNDNTIGYQIRTNSTALTTTDRTRYYRLLFTSADNTQWVPANTQYDNSATSSKTVNQKKINPFGRIVYMTGTTNVPAGSAVGATVTWDQYTLNLGYSFAKGSALTMTFPKPVYLKCAPQTDGSAIIDSTTPWVQDLPTTEDGKIYIFLGVAYSATNIELQLSHPIYHYKDGVIRPWLGTEVPSLYTTTGQNTDGAVTQKLFTDTVGNVETILQTLNNGGGAQ